MCSAPSAGLAQTEALVGADAFLRSSYAWRGKTRSGRWVIQPDVYLAAAGPSLIVTAGWWGNIEMADDATAGGTGLGRAFLGQNDVWLEGGLDLRPAFVRGGFVRYFFVDGAVGQTADAVTTTELYFDAWTNLGALVPRASLWLDVDRVRGAYLETALDLRVPVLPSRLPTVSLYLTGLAGWSLGQELDSGDPTRPAYFSDGGLTHVDLGLELRWGELDRYASLEIHFLLARDEGARPDNGGSGRSSMWVGLGGSDRWVLGVF
jgi:hypothetical protein